MIAHMKGMKYKTRILLQVALLIQLIPLLLDAQVTEIKNGRYSIQYDTSSGLWDCSVVGGIRMIDKASFLIISENGDKFPSTSPAYRRTATQDSFSDESGSGQKLEISFVPGEENIPGATLTFILYEGESFFTLEVEAHNTGTGPVTLREIQPVKLSEKNGGYLHFPGNPNQVSCLIDGYDPGHESKVVHFREQSELSGNTTSALYNHISEQSLVIGALSNEKAIHLMAYHLLDEIIPGYSSFDFTLSSYYVYCTMQPGESVSTGPVRIDVPANVFTGLERYADHVAAYNNIALKDSPLTGWCSWYYMYPDITEKEVMLNVDFLKNNLKDYGLEYIQVDRGRIKTGTDWLTTNSKFPHDMKWLAEQIHSAGFKAGIWTAPYWLGRESDHYNAQWVIDPFDTIPTQEGNRRRHWATWGDRLDASNEEVIAYMKDFVGTLVDQWGYDYLKNDFLVYGFPELKNADLLLLDKGEVAGAISYQRVNREITPAEAYREGVRAIREAAGAETFIMGCGTPLFHTAGFVDAARVGGDIQSKLCVSWECGTSKTVRTSAKRYYYNGRTLWIDPDCLVTWDPCGRGTFSFEEAKVRATLASFFGGMIMMSDRMYELPASRVDLLKRVIPVYPKSARPLDLFEKELPEIWLWDIEKGFASWHVLGVFNYGDTAMNREISYDYLGLDSSRQYIFYDFWDKKMPTRSSRYNYRSLMPFAREMTLELEPRSCKVIAIHEKLPHPQLISTNRHVTQGAIELEDVQWDKDGNSLSGVSRLVRSDDYKLVVTLPENYEFLEAIAGDDSVICQAHLDDPDVDRYNTVVISLKSPINQAVEWELRFRKTE